MDHPPTARRPMTDSEAADEAWRIIHEACRPERHFATAYRDDSPLPAYGSTPPVPQPDRRIVPAWAAGIAVVSIGVGVGVTGVGCGSWLILRGLAAVTLYSVLMVTLPIAAIAVVVTAAGCAIHKIRSATSVTVNQGPVYQHHETYQTRTYGLVARTRNDPHH